MGKCLIVIPKALFLFNSLKVWWLWRPKSTKSMLGSSQVEVVAILVLIYQQVSDLLGDKVCISDNLMEVTAMMQSQPSLALNWIK